MAPTSFFTYEHNSDAQQVCEMKADCRNFHMEKSLPVDWTEDDRTTTMGSIDFDSHSEADDWEPMTTESLLGETGMLSEQSNHLELITKESLLEEEELFSNSLYSGEHSANLLLERSDPLQASMDRIFKTKAARLLDLNFSLAIADAQLEGCPLIGCSTGLTSFSGHEMADLVGSSCSFLVNSVLSWEQVDRTSRQCCRDFLLAAKEGTKYKMPAYDPHDEWLSEMRPCNEFIAVQTSTHKDGWLFSSMTLMKIISLGDFDNESNYIIAVQSELPGKRSNLAQLRRHLRQLDKNMAKVLRILGKSFIVTGTMDRQYTDDDDSDLDP